MRRTFVSASEFENVDRHNGSCLMHPCDKDTSQLDPWPFSLRDLAHGPVGPMTHQPFLALDCDVYKGKREFPCQTFTRRQVVKLVERPVPNVETQGSGVRFLRGVT